MNDIGLDYFDDAVRRSQPPDISKNSWIYIKQIIDPIVALLLLLLIAPAFLMLVLLSRLDGGPSFYAHKRVGRSGQVFGCLKFRTMVTDADGVLACHLEGNPTAQVEWSAFRKLRNDPRVTRLGRIMRATSMDELPQLMNVVRGEMSLVGPRPVVQSELAEFYTPEGRAAYLSVRPGLTGLWQVSGRSNVNFAQRVALDTEYVRKASMALDARILLKTVAVVMLQRGAH
jgi:exopolysaccharide production protein ExoY